MKTIWGLCSLSLCVSLLGLAGCSSAKKSFVEEERVLFARFVPERKDDFAWENDLVAFRAYGPAARKGSESSGYDCWLKRVKYPIVNKWYDLFINQGKSYHEDHGEGYDPYHVGSSSGCGASALWINGKREALETFVSYSEPKVEKGTLSFTLNYKKKVGEDVYEEVRKISLKSAKRLFKVESLFKKNGELARNLPVSIGVATHDDKAKVTFNPQKGWLSAWEVIDGYGLGTGVFIQTDRLLKPVEVPKDPKDRDAAHGLYVTQTDKEGRITYFAGYGWEKAGEITSEKEWQDYLSRFGKKEIY